MKSKIAFCSSGSEDYIKKYERCIISHKVYSSRFNIDYYLDLGPLEENQNKLEWYWRKVYTILPYFKKYDYVCIVDLDIEFKKNAPDIRTAIDEKNSIFYVNGISDRPNSGFLIIKTDYCGEKFIKTILDWRGSQLPSYANMKGENGYVIKYIKENPENTKEIELKWNCSQPDFMNEAYVLHYTNKLKKYYGI